MPTDDAEHPVDTSRRGGAVRRYSLEVAIGALIGLALLLAVVASTGEIPFVYQGY